MRLDLGSRARSLIDGRAVELDPKHVEEHYNSLMRYGL